MNYQKKINVGKDFHHDSASLQVSGEAIYIDDMIKNSELMHASLVTSDIACGTILKIDISKLKELPFKTYFITANDIPGKNDVGPIFSGDLQMAILVLVIVFIFSLFKKINYPLSQQKKVIITQIQM